MPLVAPDSIGYDSFEPFLFDIIRYFRKSTVSESKRLFTLKRHYFKRLINIPWAEIPSQKLEQIAKHAGDEHAKDCEILQMAAKAARDIDEDGNAGLATLLELLASRMGNTNAVLEAIESNLEEAIATA